jgi:hypothetical protein
VQLACEFSFENSPLAPLAAICLLNELVEIASQSFSYFRA